jgi:hypothetical protein
MGEKNSKVIPIIKYTIRVESQKSTKNTENKKYVATMTVFQNKISGAPSDIGDLRDRIEDIERNMSKV